MLQTSWMIVTAMVLGSVLGVAIDTNHEMVKRLLPKLPPHLFSGGPAPKINSTDTSEPDLMAREGIIKISRVGGDICFDPYLRFGFQQVILNCPVIGTDYITETAPVNRTWSKFTEEGTEHVLFSVPDAENPIPNFLDINSIDYFNDNLFGGGSVNLGFGVNIEKYMIKPQTLIFSATNVAELDPDDAVFGTWKCTVSNSSGSDSALTTLSICNDTAPPNVCDRESEGDIRLVGGSPTAGRVEVCLDGYWGTICDTEWDKKEAEVICRQLGLPYRGAVPVRSAGFGEGIGPIYFDALYCKGCEDNLYTCDFKIQQYYSTCTHGEDAGVICPDYNIELPCSDGDVRLVDGNCSAGRVEVCMNGTWGTVCDDSWDEEDVKVVCQQLGIPAILPTAASYGPGEGQILLNNMQCLGTENSLMRCPHRRNETLPKCDHSKDAGAICPSVTCPHLEKLKNGSVNYSSVEVGSNAIYKCDEGFTILGADTITCLSNGSWSDIPPTCLKSRTCPHPPKILNGAVSYSSVEVGSSATYRCDRGFSLSGADTRICAPCGAWSGVPPTCWGSKFCTVAQVGAIQFEGSTANIIFEGFGSKISGYVCQQGIRRQFFCSSPLSLETTEPQSLKITPQGCNSAIATTLTIANPEEVCKKEN